jgi:hypothetical protein
MRDTYHEQLDDILAELERMTRTVSTAVRRSTAALLAADIRQAEEVIASDIQLDAAGEGVEEKVFELMARQSPVANELRMLVAALRMVADLERMGDLAAHVANIARLGHPGIAVPAELRPSFARMGAWPKPWWPSPARQCPAGMCRRPRTSRLAIRRWTSSASPSSGPCSMTTGRTGWRRRSR